MKRSVFSLGLALGLALGCRRDEAQVKPVPTEAVEAVAKLPDGFVYPPSRTGVPKPAGAVEIFVTRHDTQFPLGQPVSPAQLVAALRPKAGGPFVVHIDKAASYRAFFETLDTAKQAGLRAPWLAVANEKAEVSAIPIHIPNSAEVAPPPPPEGSALGAPIAVPLTVVVESETFEVLGLACKGKLETDDALKTCLAPSTGGVTVIAHDTTPIARVVRTFDVIRTARSGATISLGIAR